MKTNKGFAPIAIVLVIITVLSVGCIAYYAGKSSKIPSQDTQENNYQPQADQNTPVVNSNTTTQTLVQPEPKEDLLEYVNNEAGFSFKYPKKFGEVTLRSLDIVQLGEGYQGTVGVPGKGSDFYFSFYTKGYVVGDSPAVTKMHEPKCDAPYSFCEFITLGDGSMVKLLSEIGHPIKNFNTYIFNVPFDTRSKYLGVTFVSNFDRSILVDIASQLKVFPSK